MKSQSSVVRVALVLFYISAYLTVNIVFIVSNEPRCDHIPPSAYVEPMEMGIDPYPNTPVAGYEDEVPESVPPVTWEANITIIAGYEDEVPEGGSGG